MSRVSLAFRCFFGLLFGRSLPREAAAFLPEGPPTPAALPEPAARPALKAAPKEEPRAAPPPQRPAAADSAAHHRDGALALLALLQREGRLVDFLRESVDDYADADIGAAVRDIHRGCRKVIDEHFVLEPVMPGQEEERGGGAARLRPGRGAPDRQGRGRAAVLAARCATTAGVCSRSSCPP